MLDIDHFKRVNDTYGHRIGDEVIRSVVASCRSSIREIDFLGRYGGEEFMILAQEVDDQMALLLAERLRESIENMRIMTDKGEVSVTVSFGIAAIQEDIVDVTALINRADAALYEAKRAGRNRVAVA
jgi:diguanylate cyclase (GGDEF)-like protein